MMDNKKNYWNAFSQSCYLLYALLLVQLIISPYFIGAHWLAIFMVGIGLSLIYLLSLSISVFFKKLYLFQYGWATFNFGGLGMLIGHKIDQYWLTPHSQHMNHSSMNVFSFSHLFFNWMTVVMLIFCLPVCVFFTHCKLQWYARYTLHATVIIFMLLGMAAGHLFSMLLTHNVVLMHYSMVAGMSVCASLAYALMKQLLQYYSVDRIYNQGESL